MTTQPEALRLADALRTFPSNKTMIDLMDDASSELRRQHSRIKELEAEKAMWIRRADKTWHEKQFTDRIAELEAGLDVVLHLLEYIQHQTHISHICDTASVAAAKLKEVRR